MSEKEIKNVPRVSKKVIRAQNKTLRNVFIGLFVFALIILSVAFFINSSMHFKYRDVEFNVVEEGQLIFYNVIFPINNPVTGKHVADYNFYLRNDPRKLENVFFEGELDVKENVVLNMTKDFSCDGDGVIAVANMVQVLEKFGAEVIKDPNAGCDFDGKYTFIQIRQGEKTGIEPFGIGDASCYNFYVKDCEILEVTEKFILEVFVKANENKE